MQRRAAVANESTGSPTVLSLEDFNRKIAAAALPLRAPLALARPPKRPLL